MCPYRSLCLSWGAELDNDRGTDTKCIRSPDTRHQQTLWRGSVNSAAASINDNHLSLYYSTNS